MKDNNENKLSEQNVKGNHATDQEKRRKAVKNILMAGGSAITAGQLGSEKWIKPIVDSVVLPAHAATSAVGFSIADPVSLTYRCSGEDVIVDIRGYINQPIAGIRVNLRLEWTHSITPDPTREPPLIMDVETDEFGNYKMVGRNIGYQLDSVTVVASLTDYPEAATDTDQLDVNTDGGSYYCLPPDPG